MDRKKIAETTLKRIEPGSEPLLNETPPTLVLCPPRQNMRVDFRTQLAPTHVGCVLCGGRTDRIQGVWAMWESRVNGEDADGWFTGRIHRELTVRIRTCPTMEADHDLAMS